MNEKHSLLNKIKSTYILKDILTLAFRNIKSVLKFIAYDKVLLNKLDINIKDYYDYKIKKEVEKNKANILGIVATVDTLLIIFPLIIYDIAFYIKGKFNEENLKEGYDKKKKNYVDFMDNYILWIFLLFLLICHTLIFLYSVNKTLALNAKQKIIIYFILLFILLSYNIANNKKYYYTSKIIKEEKYINNAEESLWFQSYDFYMIYIMILNLFFKFFVGFFFIYYLCASHRFINKLDDEKTFYLTQINGVNICNYILPSEFENLNKKNKIEMIFKKENMKIYIYKLNDTQIKLIDKINHLRARNKIPKLEYKKEQQLSEYIINNKTELIFYTEKNIYEFSNKYYLIKYPINECQDDFKDKDIINILKKDSLDTINVIRKNNYEYIALYNRRLNNEKNKDKINRKNNENQIVSINNNNLREILDFLSINVINTKDRFNVNEY